MRRGFVDLQVNGLMGIDFSDGELTLEKVRFVTRELVKRGTLAYCPTVIGGSVRMYENALGTLAAAMEEPHLRGHLLGIHLEGPFLSMEEGARGAHLLEWLREPSLELLDRILEIAEGKISMLTLAPELPGAEALIRRAGDHGVMVALGHTHADDDSLERAVRAGARCATHLGNGIREMLPRHRNPIWGQLARDELYCTFITDGHHLPAAFVKAAIRAKGTDRSIVITDASSLAALPPGEYFPRGRHCIIGESGRISFAGTNYLAGSSAVMWDCMNYLASLDFLSEAELWRLGMQNALKLLGKDLSCLKELSGPQVKLVGKSFDVSE